MLLAGNLSPGVGYDSKGAGFKGLGIGMTMLGIWFSYFFSGHYPEILGERARHPQTNSPPEYPLPAGQIG